jgi:hypothetical protein
VNRVLLFLPLLLAPLRAAPDPAEILRRLGEAFQENRRAAASFVFRENISYSEFGPGIKLRNRHSRTFEVVFIEGEIYYRLVAIDGQPLSPEQEKLEQNRLAEVERFRKQTALDERRRLRSEAERQRYSFDLGLLASTHTAAVAGETVIEGRPVVLVNTEPRKGTPRPITLREWVYLLKGRLWIDRETGFPVRAEYTQVKTGLGRKKGGAVSYEWTRVEDAWLAKRIVSRIRPADTDDAPITLRETDQSYSNYRRFRAESHILIPEGQ